MTNLVLLSGPVQAAEDHRLVGLAAWMGVTTTAVAIQDSMILKRYLLNKPKSGPSCLAMSAETLVLLRKLFTAAADMRQLFDESSVQLLVFGFSASTEQDIALSWLTA